MRRKSLINDNCYLLYLRGPHKFDEDNLSVIPAKAGIHFRFLNNKITISTILTGGSHE
jgi:hypothetical protein